MAFAMASEIERDLISQRTTEALQARKQQGMPLGRPKGIGKSKYAQDLSVAELAAVANVSPSHKELNSSIISAITISQ